MQSASHDLFEPLAEIIRCYLGEFARVYPPNEIKDIFPLPYYGLVIEKVVAALGPDPASG